LSFFVFYKFPAKAILIISRKFKSFPCDCNPDKHDALWPRRTSLDTKCK